MGEGLRSKAELVYWTLNTEHWTLNTVFRSRDEEVADGGDDEGSDEVEDDSLANHPLDGDMTGAEHDGVRDGPGEERVGPAHRDARGPRAIAGACEEERGKLWKVKKGEGEGGIDDKMECMRDFSILWHKATIKVY